MYVVVWSYEVAPEARDEFERAYGPHGDWAALFAQSVEYRGSELLRPTEASAPYFVLDRWTSQASYDEFREVAAEQYRELDQRCARLRSAERFLGGFEAAG